MAQTTLSVRMDEQVKKQFDEFCNEVGLNASVAVNIFVKSVLRERKIPFEISVEADPFYSETNIKRLKKSIAQLETGNCTEHDLLEVD